MTKIKWYVEPTRHPKSIIVRDALEKAGNSNRLHKELDICLGTILAWRRGAIPLDDNLEKLKDYLKGEKKPEHDPVEMLIDLSPYKQGNP